MNLDDAELQDEQEELPPADGTRAQDDQPIRLCLFPLYTGTTAMHDDRIMKVAIKS